MILSIGRHNTYLQDCTGVRDATYSYTIHDLKHLMLKFAFEKSFSEDSGGGGRESNVQLLPYIMHMALYVINTYVSYSPESLSKTESFFDDTILFSEYPFYNYTCKFLIICCECIYLQNTISCERRKEPDKFSKAVD